MKNFLLICIILVGFSSCEKKELPVPASNAITTQLELGSDYRDQIWFNLNDNKEVSKNLKSIWDLSFESSEEGWHILLNSSKFMAASFHEGLDLNDDISISSAVWQWDAPTGALDSTAFGDWTEKNGIYLINRGYDHAGIHQGYVKLKINSFDNFRYTISYAELNSSDIKEVEIEKNTTHNFTPFSFNEENPFPEVMPNKEDWDIAFTQYTHIYYDLDEVYLVVGVLLNRNGVLAKTLYDISNDEFTNIDQEFADSLDMNSNINEIGFDWKYLPNFDPDNPQDPVEYEIRLGQVYIIKDVEGYFYKLRFISYYSNGVKGAPEFQFNKL